MPRDCSSDILVKDMAAFCPCSKSLCEAKVKRFIRLIALTKEVLNPLSLDSVLWFTLRRSVLIKCSNLRKQRFKMCGSKRKGIPGSRVEPKHGVPKPTPTVTLSVGHAYSNHKVFNLVLRVSEG